MNRFTLMLLIVPALFSSYSFADHDISVPLTRTHGATYAVDARIDGIKGDVAMTLDTGAAYSTLSTDVVTKLVKQGKAVKTGELTARLANGDYCPLYTYKISALSIGDGCVLRNVEVAVTSDNSRNLLGLSTLQHTAPFTIAFGPDAELKMQRCDDATYAQTEVSMNTQ